MVGQTANYNGSYKMEPGMGMGHHHHDHINSHHHHESKNIAANSKKLFFALHREFHLVKLIFEMLFKGRILTDVPCKVCRDNSSGKHYGIFACDG
jgi:hypothetical protein